MNQTSADTLGSLMNCLRKIDRRKDPGVSLEVSCMETGRVVEHSIRSSLLHSNINCKSIYLIIICYSLVIFIVIMLYILL